MTQIFFMNGISKIWKSKNVSLPTNKLLRVLLIGVLLLAGNVSKAQTDTTKKERQFKNVIRYNLSGAILFGIDKYIVLGYERLLTPRQSFTVNVGKAALPKLSTIITDSFELSQDLKNTGFNVSVDYRFYLAKENKHAAPHGVYIGPYYSFNSFTRENRWSFVNSSTGTYSNTNSKLTIHTIGFELGYQFILWKRMTLDFLMVGPGLGIYKYNVNFDNNLDPDKQEQLREGLMKLLTQKFPGMDYVFSEKQLDARGTVSTTTVGYRYLIHIGYAF